MDDHRLMNHQRSFHTATLLPNGKVLVAGGDDGDNTSAELYDPVAGTWSSTGSLNHPRVFHTATLLNSGLVLAVGGPERAARKRTIRSLERGPAQVR